MSENTYPHPATLEREQLLQQCTVTFGRASGPGGQHRNKVETAAQVRHDPSGCIGQASERRSREQNLSRAIFRLRVELALSVRTSANQLPATASDRWQARVRDRRLAINPKHDDFPALLAEALDRWASLDDDVAAAAEALGISTSQWVKLVKHEPRGLKLVNDKRTERGKPRLK